MPGMSGPTTLETLRKMDAFRDTPAIFMTARAQPAEIEELKAISDAVVKAAAKTGAELRA